MSAANRLRCFCSAEAFCRLLPARARARPAPRPAPLSSDPAASVEACILSTRPAPRRRTSNPPPRLLPHPKQSNADRGGVCRWSNVFDTMTKEREEAESAEAISSREAMQMVNEMLDKMQDKYTTSIDS